MTTVDDWLDHAAYPFESHYLRVPAGRLHYIDEGEGPAVVMVHGNPTWSFLYRHLVHRLRSHFRCIALDHIGFGLSDKPTSWGYRPSDHADNLRYLVEHLKLNRMTLVVHDWGGPIGLASMRSQPERLERLVAINTWAWPVRHDLRLRLFSTVMGGAVGRLAIRRYNAFARVLLPLAFADRKKLSRAIHEQYLRPLNTPANRLGCATFPGQISQASAWLSELWRAMDRFADTPVLLAWGMKDPAFRRRELNCWARRFPRAEIARFPGVGHFVPEEAPVKLSQTIDRFLASE